VAIIWQTREAAQTLRWIAFALSIAAIRATSAYVIVERNNAAMGTGSNHE
jgi:hypothetical protein